MTTAASDGGMEEDIPEAGEPGDVIGAGFAADAHEPVEEFVTPSAFESGLGPVIWCIFACGCGMCGRRSHGFFGIAFYMGRGE